MLENRYIYIILHLFFKFNIFFADFHLGQNLWVPSCGQFFSSFCLRTFSRVSTVFCKVPRVRFLAQNENKCRGWGWCNGIFGGAFQGLEGLVGIKGRRRGEKKDK